MKRLRYALLLATFFSLLATELFGQYYDWGQSPASIRWNRIKTPWNSFVYPDGYEAQAARLVHYFDTIRPWIGYGFDQPAFRQMPVVMHTQNYNSNGLVMLAPKRMEFIVTPSPSMAAMPWLKQLALHESRHAVQFGNTTRGFVRFLGYVLGQQGSLVGGALLPNWLMEGDAVLAETQMSSFGRGLQPSFTIEYRAMALEGTKHYAIDKYFCGSYKDYMPDHYQLGYQIASYAYTKYQRNIWNEVARYGSSYPFLILTTKIALGKYYHTSVNKLFRETFADLDRFWHSLPHVDNSSSILPTPTTSYTTYSSPLHENDTTVLALKNDMDRYWRIVRVDPRTGRESVLFHTGHVSSAMTLGAGRLWWTEYRQSTFWDQRVNSQLCWYDLASGRRGCETKDRTVTWPAVLADGRVAAVEYDYNGSYAIRCGTWRCPLPDTVSVHGLAYDDRSARLYFIGLSDGGMWLGSVQPDGEGFEVVKPATYASLANLKAGGGRLYYNSIASGKDEAHLYDLASRREYRITTSRYGSFSPSPSADGRSVVLATYTPQGYLLARQAVEPDSLVAVPYAEIPANTVNPPRIRWEVPNFDRVRVSDTTLRQTNRYRKGLHLFNFHSWAPFSFDPEKIVDENRFNVQAGATIMSQNLLSSTFAQVRYGYASGESFLRAKLQYYGLAPKFEVQAEWSSVHQSIYKPDSIRLGGLTVGVPMPASLKDYFDLQASAYLPILLSSGYHIRRLTPTVVFQHNNARMFNYHTGGYFAGLQKLSFSLQYSEQVRMATRDLRPRWGYVLSLSGAGNPFHAEFGRLWSLYGAGYLPGMAAHHSLLLRAAGQYQAVGDYNYQQKLLFPRGANYNISAERYGAVSADYQLPLCYPDGGIPSILYFKRIRANLFGDYARFRTIGGQEGRVWSYGLDLIFDISPVRLPPSVDTSLTLSIQKPSDRKGVVVGVEFSLPI